MRYLAFCALLCPAAGAQTLNMSAGAARPVAPVLPAAAFERQSSEPAGLALSLAPGMDIAVPDQALVGPLKADHVLAPLRAAAAAALAAKGDGPVTPERVSSWILGLQGLTRLPVEAWASLEEVNKRLAPHGIPPIRLSDIDLLVDADGEIEPESVAARLGLPNLRELGALHDSGRIQIYKGLADILDERHFSSVVLHEHLARLGYEHRSQVVPLAHKITGQVFGEPVIHEDLEIMVHRALRGPHEEVPIPRKKPLSLRDILDRPLAQARSWRPSPLSTAALGTVALAWGAALAMTVLALRAGGGIPWSWLGLVALGTAGVLASLAGPRILGGLMAPQGGVIGGVPYRFDPGSLEVLGFDEASNDDGRYAYVSLRDNKGRQVSLAAGQDGVMEIQWGRGDGVMSGHFFILSYGEFQRRPEFAAQGVSSFLFERKLWPHFERAVEDFLRDTRNPERRRRHVRDFSKAFLKSLEDKNGDTGDSPMAEQD